MTAYHDIADMILGYSWGGGETENAINEHLTFIADIEIAEPDYSFDLLRVYVRKADGAILYATDSGCSCPSPFEDVRVGDLKETTLSGIEDAARAAHGDSYSSKHIADVLADVRRYVPAMKAAGAR